MVDLLLFSIYLQTSWDLVSKIEIAGFSIRLLYLIEVFLIPLILLKRKNLFPQIPGIFYLLIWSLIIALFIPNTTFIERNIGYFAWLILSILLIFLIVSYVNNFNTYIKHIKFLIYSYVIMALFGLFQFLLGLKGISIYTTQWWIPNVLPRLNGLSYEPSYYATYLAGGFSFLYWLTFARKIYLIKFQRFYVYIILIAIILSSSRIGILAIFFTLLLHFVTTYYRIILGKVNKSIIKPLTLLILLIIGFTLLPNKSLFLRGTGLENTPAHSVNTRLEDMKYTFQVFLNNPIIGVSLGGIPAHIAQLQNKIVTNQYEAKKFEGINVFLEVLAASGLIGFIFFALFWISIFRSYLKLSKLAKKISHLRVLESITSSFFIMVLVQSFCLTMNQNILRPYYWLSIAFLLASLVLLRKHICNGSLK